MNDASITTAEPFDQPVCQSKMAGRSGSSYRSGYEQDLFHRQRSLVSAHLRRLRQERLRRPPNAISHKRLHENYPAAGFEDTVDLSSGGLKLNVMEQSNNDNEVCAAVTQTQVRRVRVYKPNLVINRVRFCTQSCQPKAIIRDVNRRHIRAERGKLYRV
jgi:hypothetical protein